MPKGAQRAALEKEGRIQRVEFTSTTTADEVSEVIRDAFHCGEFHLLHCTGISGHLEVDPNTAVLDGETAVAVRSRSTIYLCEDLKTTLWGMLKFIDVATARTYLLIIHVLCVVRWTTVMTRTRDASPVLVKPLVLFSYTCM